MSVTAGNTGETAALVLFSGGQDSTVCLAHALSRYDRVETVGFDYGQRHEVELSCRAKLLEALPKAFPDWAPKLGPDHMLDLKALGEISETALTGDAEIVMMENGLPSTFVPGRNLLFFTYAAALGYRRGLKVLVGGMCETDYSGYPDCRNETLQALQQALRLGTEEDFTLETPLMWLTKAETWALADELGGPLLVDLIVELSHTCYRGDHQTRHDWGYGCGECPACQLRARGFAEWQDLGNARDAG
ncbi:7-cyano-7-deazaguanine synthase QueC [Methyloligella sp. 2.7D]|uniref:7-cyano-7-deazaguanine synthase QueC n=1 Tax=unclassified Methyloligella TaxID=2625955 RepID=UPI00157C71E8|nr:7-cyano-7-deazaguanine synthase QueC [Methyloligella sp. GL2]QKP77493.1 7-cyano-7-deazaguanine synthase QueC [Methyloligella sp. GL2]